MGWLYGYSWKTKHDIIRHCTGPEMLGTSLTVLAHTCVGNHLWCVLQPTDGKPPFIGLCLLSKDRKDGIWGYKDMTESMHPYYYDCPLCYLDLAPQPEGESAASWREGVLAYHEKRTRPVAIGETYRLVGARDIVQVTITSVRPLHGLADDGRTYRVPKRMLGEQIA
jgi:hypothetical protein